MANTDQIVRGYDRTTLPVWTTIPPRRPCPVQACQTAVSIRNTPARPKLCSLASMLHAQPATGGLWVRVASQSHPAQADQGTIGTNEDRRTASGTSVRFRVAHGECDCASFRQTPVDNS